MAIIFHIFYKGKDNAARDFAAEMIERGLVNQIRYRPGNLSYHYFQSMEDPETILLVDSWSDQEALDLHHASPMMQEILALREKYGLSARAEKLRADEEGVPEADQVFMSQEEDAE
ncbi:putative quinol monooxygenase [Streptococcus gallinaceus]|uniref:Quinol monooxygenase YgiN n=1 Tax=Streptococcus gallinaceus TaxID=165758 RepID=A0ABV2JLX0_9STRE